MDVKFIFWNLEFGNLGCVHDYGEVSGFCDIVGLCGDIDDGVYS
jgi:hypothetical protein